MKQILILSGKGGTGKTTVAASFIRLAKAKVFADCDVDAPNLHLLFPQKEEPQKNLFFGLPKAKIDTTLCTSCDLCRQHCRFSAISKDGNGYHVDPFACEGCAVCGALCPVGAVSFEEAPGGDLFLYCGEGVTFSTATLRMGSGASGKLVSEVKQQIKEASKKAALVIVDGSPGIGCPVIASLSGADLVLIVAEPSLSGISDMERIIKTAGIFGTKIAVCVNKYDTHMENTEHIKRLCEGLQIPFAGVIPYDPEVLRAVNEGRTIVEKDCPAGRAVLEIFEKTIPLVLGECVV